MKQKGSKLRENQMNLMKKMMLQPTTNSTQQISLTL